MREEYWDLKERPVLIHIKNSLRLSSLITSSNKMNQALPSTSKKQVRYPLNQGTCERRPTAFSRSRKWNETGDASQDHNSPSEIAFPFREHRVSIRRIYPPQYA